MSIRAFLYSRRAEEGSVQTQWPSAILPIDNDPDKDTLAISQTSNKAKHSLSSANNLCGAARVMDKPAASSECEQGNKALDGQEVAESILFIDLGLFTAWWHVAVTTFLFFFFIPQTHKDKEYYRKEKNIHSAKHFTFQQSILSVRSFARPLMAAHTTLHTHTHLQGWYFSRDRRGKLVTLFLIGIEIPSFFSSQQPLLGNADWLSSKSS